MAQGQLYTVTELAREMCVTYTAVLTNLQSLEKLKLVEQIKLGTGPVGRKRWRKI